jgi:group I intron endonuclease
MSGVIYELVCLSTDMKYIGQAKDLKYKNGKPYNYGASGRWNDHVSTAYVRDTPLCVDIRKYGRNDFIVNILEHAPLTQLDEREAYWINKKNTLQPQGYNVAKHSRNRHRMESNLYKHYNGVVKDATISPINCDGIPKLVYVYLDLTNGKRERIAFGQQKNSVYEEALREATEFLDKLQCPYHISNVKSNVLSEKYASKISEFEGKEITAIRITSASNLIAVYIGTSDMKLKKDHKRICFGGKTITKDEAYEIAKEFISELNISEDIIQDSIKSSQQVTAL